MTANGLTNACNQKSSRQPVMNLQQGDVQRLCHQLKEKRMVRIEENFKSNTEKYSQLFCNAMLGKNQFDAAQFAIICLLLLRGPQTPGELRSRSGRLHSFESNQEVTAALSSLMDFEGGAIVARLPRQAGRKDHEYAHLFAGDIESVAEDMAAAVSAPSNSQNNTQKMNQLETRVMVLEQALTELAERLGEDIDLSKIAAALNPADDASPE
jgi:uncharacterized protein YceH (UPF0502 family)